MARKLCLDCFQFLTFGGGAVSGKTKKELKEWGKPKILSSSNSFLRKECAGCGREVNRFYNIR